MSYEATLPTDGMYPYGERYSGAEITAAINDSFEHMDYRPVVVAVIRDDLDRVLLVESAKAAGYWTLPQGGIEPGETLGEALEREVYEEAGIPCQDIEIGALTEIIDIDAAANRTNRHGFQRGRRYFITQVRYHGGGALILQAEEVSDAVWAHDEEVPTIMAPVRAEKRALTERALQSN